MSDKTSQKWHQMHDRWMGSIQPGSKIAWERGGRLFTETVQEVRYTSGSAAIYPELPWWQRAMRRLTPSRWRKPLKPIRPYQLPTVSFTTGPVSDEVKQTFERTQASLAKAGEIIDGLIRKD